MRNLPHFAFPALIFLTIGSITAHAQGAMVHFTPPNGSVHEHPAQTEERIVWGKSFGGVQGGLSFKSDGTRYKTGTKVQLNLYWRNMTDRPITLDYGIHPGSAFRPTVRNRKGERLPMEVDLVMALEQRTTLQPGQTLYIAPLVMRLVPPGGPPVDGLEPAYPLAPGHYSITVSGNEKDSSVPTSGSLEFEVFQK